MSSKEEIPSYLEIHENIAYDNSIERIEYEVIPCSKSSVQDLNNQSAQLRFHVGGEYLYRPSAIGSYFKPTIKFRTKLGANNENNAEITLASNYFLYMFGTVSLKIGGQEIENYSYPGVVCDAFFHLDKKYRGFEGEIYGFIPDTSRNADRKQVTTAAIAAGGAVPANHVTNNADYNSGFDRRMKLYNYTVENDNTERHNYLVVPLKHLFGFFNEVDIVLQYIPMDIELIREKQANKPRAYYGAANTAITFDGDNPPTLGITDINLILEKPSPRPDLKVKLENEYKKVIKTPYLRRYCEETFIDANATASFMRSFHKGAEGIARYVCVVFKPRRDETAHTNFQLCVHANIEDISVTYCGNKYPHLTQDCDFGKNNFTPFYNSYLYVAKAFGAEEPGLSMEEFRDRYTHFWIPLEAKPECSTGGELTIKIKRRAVPDNDDDPKNPRNLVMYTIVITETICEIDCPKRTASIVFK